MYHIPVLKEEAINLLAVESGGDFVDATLGNGGYSEEILKRNKKGKVLAIDINKETIEIAKERLKEEFGNEEIKNRVIFVQDNFANIKQIISNFKIKPKGIVADLGISSWLLEESQKGFSFRKNEILDMRFAGGDLKALDIVNYFSEDRIKEILETFGEERKSSLIAKEIVKARKIEPIITTFDLKNVVEKIYKEKALNKSLARVFQSLRIFINDEIENLKAFLKDSFEVLSSQWRLLVVSFHSLEDREVKNFFKQKKQENQAIMLTKKPIRPSWQEISKNKKSRSAKLRAIIKKL